MINIFKISSSLLETSCIKFKIMVVKLSLRSIIIYMVLLTKPMISSGFVNLKTLQSSTKTYWKNSSSLTQKRYLTNDSSSGKETLSSRNQSNVFILSFDGAIANTAEWRANLAIDVACETWPHLKEYIYSSPFTMDDKGDYNYNDEEDSQDREWLVNKLSALDHAMYSDIDAMMGCDAVLLTRLLLEEQLLDQGRSNGCKGKYGSKFHPTSTSNSYLMAEQSYDDNSSSNNGSRPLTVGEISANWVDGACLRETTRYKYNIDRKDPIPVIKRNILRALESVSLSSVLSQVHVNHLIGEALDDYRNNKVYVLVGHECHIPVLTGVLSSQMTKPPTVISHAMEALHKDEENIVIVHPANDKEKVLPTLLNSLIASSSETNNNLSIHIIHNSIQMLQQSKSFFGDDSPRLTQGFGSIGKNINLKLSLPTWGTNSPQQRNDAEMDPWLNLIDEYELSEQMSYRILSQHD